MWTGAQPLALDWIRRRILTRILSVSFVLAVLALQISSASAEMLSDALMKAYRTNPDLEAARAGLRATGEDISKARSLWRPTVSLAGVAGRSSGNGTIAGVKYQAQDLTWSTALVAFQPILTSGRNGAERRQAEARVRGAQAKLRGKEQDILAKTASAFAEVARNEAVLDLVQADINTLRALSQELKTLRDRKQATDSDVDQVQAALQAQRATCLSNLADVQDSWRTYAQLVGETPVLAQAAENGAPRVNPCIDTAGLRARSSITMPDNLPRLPATLEDAESAALRDAPDVEAARADDEEAQHAISAAIAEFLPSAGISVALGASGNELEPNSLNREASVNAEIKIPLYSSGAEYADLRAARESHNEAKMLLVSAQRQSATDVAHNWYKLGSVRTSRRVTRDQAASLERAFDGLRKEIAIPSLHRSVTDLLGLRGALLGARIALVNSARDEVATLYRLLADIGRLTPESADAPPKETSANPDRSLLN